MEIFKILAINPGSTSTKISVFENESEIFTETIGHSAKYLEIFDKVFDQLEFRKELVNKALKENRIELGELSAVVGRGGLLKPVSSGTYQVNDLMVYDLKKGIRGEHASNLGGVIACELGKKLGIPSYIVDPVVVDEMEPVARLSGFPEIERRSVFHALNHKAVARRYAKDTGKKYEELNLILVHLGGGISVGAHKGGRIVDVNNALDGDGPFSTERSGGVPAGDLVRYCFSGKYNIEEIEKKLVGRGGMVGYLGTNSVKEVIQKIRDGDEKALLVFEGMVYQICKNIGGMSAVLKGEVDAIVITGGIAHSQKIIEDIKENISYIAPISVYPGEDEMRALAEGALRVLKGEEEAKEYV